MTVRAVRSCLLVGAVALASGCGDDDSAVDVPSGSLVVESTLADGSAVNTTVADVVGDSVGDSTAATSAPATSTAAPVTSEPAATATTAIEAASDTTAPTTATTAPSVGGSWTDPDGLFTLDYPGEPTATQIPVPDVTDGATLTAYIYETADAAFLANRTDSTTLGEEVDDVSLDDAVTGSMSFIGGTVGGRESVTVQGREAIRFDFAVAGGVGEGLTIGDGVILYQVLGIGEASAQPELAAFVDSFGFTDGAS